MRGRCCLLALLWFLCACGSGELALIDVFPSGVPEGSHTLLVTVQGANELEPRLSKQVRSRLDHFVLRFFGETAERLTISVEALSDAGCRIADSSESIIVNPSTRHELSLSLRPAAGCLLVVEAPPAEQATVVVSPQNVTCSPRCELSLPLGAVAEVDIPRIDPGQSYEFLGPCQGRQRCQVSVSRGVTRVQVITSPRVCDPSGFCYQLPPWPQRDWRIMRGQPGGGVWLAHYDGTLLQLQRGRSRLIPASQSDTEVIRGSSGKSSIGRIWPAADQDLWATTDPGRLLHWQGSWLSVDSGVLDPLYAIWGGAPDDIWAVGATGALTHWDGRRWTAAVAPVAADLQALWGSSPHDIWAAGAGGTLMHFDGSRWDSVPSRSRSDLYAVWGSGPRSVFAAGDNGTILRWDGEQWTQAERLVETVLSSLGGTGPQDVWAGGQDGSMLRYDGARWSIDTSARLAYQDHVYGLVQDADTGVWLLSASGLRRRVAGGWLEVARSPVVLRRSAVWGNAADDVWLSGVSDFGDATDMIHFDGRRFTAMPAPRSQYSDLWGSGSRDVWAAGSRSAHWDGSSWKEYPDLALEAVWGSTAEDVWGLTDAGQIRHWDGRSWSGPWEGVRLPVVGSLRAMDIAGSGPRDVWAVGGRGTILHWDGSMWSSVTNNFNGNLHAVAAISPMRAWALADEGVLAWDGARWEQVADVPSDRELQHLFAFNAVQMWVVTRKGDILRFEGGSLRRSYTIPGNEHLSIWGSGPSDLWVAGSSILHKIGGSP